MGDNRNGTFYLTVSPGRYYSDLRVDKATSKKPRSTPEGSIVVALKIEVPRSAFQPIRPEVTIVVPEELVQHPVLVEAQDANDA